MEDISIHALAKRATYDFTLPKHSKTYFNPRPRKEGDRCKALRLSVGLYFNPRPRKEGDDTTINIENILEFIAIHALVKRATIMISTKNIGKMISIHALVKRATNITSISRSVSIISIHALVKRAT